MTIFQKTSVLLISLAALSLPMTNAANLEQSSQNEIFDNPFIVTGFNPQTNMLTGYVSALRTSPGRTDECKFVFSGRSERKNSLPVSIKNAVNTSVNGNAELTEITKGRVASDGKQKKIIIHHAALPGDCDWILSFIGGEKVIQNGEGFSILIDGGIIGDWLAVYVIRSKRAYFHQSPKESSSGKSFLIAGDLIYVYDEKKDWYYVKFKGRKKTSGWIKKSDTVQFAH